MVDQKIINDTVKRMLVSNIDEETIVSTLKDIGIDGVKAKEIIANVAAGNVSVSPEIGTTSERKQTIPPIEYNTDQKIQSMQNELQTQGEKSELQETTTHTLLNDHAQKLDDVNKKVDDVHKVVLATNVDASLKVKLTELEQKVGDISAQTIALMEIMKKILEANREILTELKSK